MKIDQCSLIEHSVETAIEHSIALYTAPSIDTL